MQQNAEGSARRPGRARRTRVRARFILAVALLAAVAAVGLAAPFAMSEASEPTALTYTQLISALDAGRIETLTVDAGREIRGRWRVGQRPVATKVADDASADFTVVYPLASAEAIASRAADRGVQVDFLPATDSSASTKLLSFTVQLALVGVIICLLLIYVSGRSGGPRIGRTVAGEDTTFDDLTGTQGAAEELREVVDFLRAPGAFAALGARVPRGVLLFGPPGTGKTLLARAVAGEADVPFLHISGSEVTGFVVGLGAQRVRGLFRRARRRGGVIFIDELDALGSARGNNRAHNEDDRTLNQLLVEMDGFSPADGVVVIGATNRPESLDPALRRRGRFDRDIAVDLPTASGREAILALHIDRRGVPIAEDVDLARIARLTPGSSGADLANLINEAAIGAVRTGAERVDWNHFDAARDRIALGVPRAGFHASEREWRVVACHEAGHVIAGLAACPEDGLHKVTIQPRGGSMGGAHFAPEDDKHLHTRSYLQAQIIKALGGRVAEELVFGPEGVTGGAESDLVHANRIARRMVHRLGMGEAGLLVNDVESAPLSTMTQARLDEQVGALLNQLYDRTRAILRKHRAALDALAAELRVRETMDGAQVRALLEQQGMVAAAAIDAVDRGPRCGPAA